jgi:shikimate dehydrogenase
VWVWNRTPERARALAEQLGAEAVDAPRPADILVNCTAVGLENPASLDAALKQLRLSNDDLTEYRYVVDLVYRNNETPLLRAARERGAVVVDGLEVLVQQGALSFQLWTGLPAPLEAMREAAVVGTPPAAESPEGQIESGTPSQAGSDPRGRRRRL